MNEFADVLNELEEQNLQPLQEMATVGRKDSCKELPKGMRIEVITSEYNGTGEEPHLHLFPASHKDKNGKANNYDLITRVKVTNLPPSSPRKSIFM